MTTLSSAFQSSYGIKCFGEVIFLLTKPSLNFPHSKGFHHEAKGRGKDCCGWLRVHYPQVFDTMLSSVQHDNI
ncbi:unnamed protein product [Victoria cruziana]